MTWNKQLKSKTIVGLVFAVFTIFIWGITFVSTKYLLRSFSALEILLARFIFAYIGLWVLRPRILHVSWKEELLFICAGLSGVTVYQFMENVAISFTSASNVSIIVSICPIFTAIIAQIVLKEKHLTIPFVLGFVLAIVGIAFVSFNGAVVLHLNPKGDLLALAAAVSWGFYSLFVSKINLLGLDSIVATRRIFFWAVFFMIPLAVYGILQGNPDSSTAMTFDAVINADRWKNPLNWLNLLFLGWGASAFCFAAWNIACDRLGTVRATAGIYLIPVVTIVFAFFALGERISLMGGIGAALTIAGLFLSEQKKLSR
ncbi:MAG: DMT family transporter [Treponema sp.]|nr:DMT family transporter [Treponema sp.]